MKSLKYIFSILVIAIMFNACEDDDPIPNKEPVSGEPTDFTVSESISDTEVIGNLMAEDESKELSFSMLLNSDDLFEVTATGELSLASGKSLDYEKADWHKIVVSVTDGELTTSYVLTIGVTDDIADNPVATFKDTTFSFLEVGGDTTITILFDQPIARDADIVVNLVAQGGVYNEDYTTIPEGISGTFSIAVPAGAESATFTLSMIDDDLLEDDEVITFTLANGKNDLIKAGTEKNEIQVTVISDEVGDMFVLMENSGETTLYSINPISGAKDSVTAITLDGKPLSGSVIDYDRAGKKVYIDNRAKFYSVDLATGAATLVKDNSAELNGIAGSSVNGTGMFIESAHAYILYSYFDMTTFTPASLIAKINLADGSVVETKKEAGIYSRFIRGIGLIGDMPYVSQEFISGGDDPTFVEVDITSLEATGSKVDSLTFSAAAIQMLADDQSIDIEDGYAIYCIDESFGLIRGTVLGKSVVYLCELSKDGTVDISIDPVEISGGTTKGCVIPSDDL